MHIASSEVGLNDALANDENRESRNITVNDNDARLLISKSMKLIDWVIIKMPISSNKTISGGKVSSLVFMEYVRKNDPNSISNLVSFISSLDLSDKK